MLNAYGNVLKTNMSSYSELMAQVKRTADELAVLKEIEGIMLTGSVTEHEIDFFSDVDLKVFHDASEAVLQEKIRPIYEKSGAKTDNLESVHSPFDDFSFLFGKIYIETELPDFIKSEEKIKMVISGKAIDDGFIHSLQKGMIIYDKNSKLAQFQKRIQSLIYSDKMAEFCLKRHEAVALKLLLHAIHRRDWAFAAHWLHRAFMDTTRILFSKNKVFFPGTKRLLSFYIPRLKKCPENYVSFWSDIFKSGIEGWEEVHKTALDFMLEIKSY